MASNKKDEPIIAPPVDRWFNLTLGSSFKDPSSKFCTLRYEFKPASIDKSQPGTLNKNKDDRVTVEFRNNQHGKPKVSFEGSSEDYKENDAVLFFDGECFRLERLHRSVKRLRHVRQPGESAAAATSVSMAAEASSPPLAKAPKFQSSNKGPLNPVAIRNLEMIIRLWIINLPPQIHHTHHQISRTMIWRNSWIYSMMMTILVKQIIGRTLPKKKFLLVLTLTFRIKTIQMMRLLRWT